MRPDSARQMISFAGRLLAAGFLLLALLPLSLPWTRAELDLAVLMDESQSMPRDFSVQAWQQVLELLELSPADTAVHLLRFAAAPEQDVALLSAAELAAEQALPRRQALDTTTTNIARALQQVLYGLPADRPSAILLVSDGAAAHGDTAAALRAAYDARVPVYLMSPATAVIALPLRLLEVRVPPQVTAGERVPVRVRLESARGGAAQLLLETDAGVFETRQLSLAAGVPASVTFEYPAQAPGVQQLTVRLQPVPDARADDRASIVPSDPSVPWLVQTRALNVLGLAPVFVVSRAPEQNPLVSALRLADWKVDSAAPAAFMARRASWNRAGVVVLDDVAITELSASAWDALIDAVRATGKGLLVLGGANSFGAGAYRHSQLEKILPVTAEAPRPQPPAAVMFVVDRSGSMGSAQSGPSRLALARRAVAASVELLLPGDQLGIIAFAADVETRLALMPRESATDSVAAALDMGAAGGTLLAPALRAALQQLRPLNISQRLIILVTDGFAGEENLSAVAQQLRAANITVIALAVGNEADQARLRELTSFNDGRLLEVSNIASLPRLMPSELAAQRAPAQAGVTQPEQVRQIPFLSGSRFEWPALSAYMVSKARADSRVFLRSAQGDPLYATGVAGAGRVAVLPAGLGQWATAWWAWPDFGHFLGGLLLSLGQNDSQSLLALRVQSQPGQLVYRIDQGALGETPDHGPGVLSVRGPAGRVSQWVPRLESPGHYRAVVPALASGLYQATLHLGDHSLRQAIYRNASNEFQLGAAQTGAAQTDSSTQGQIQTWIERGWLRRWNGAAAFADDWPRGALLARQPLVLLALLSYVLVLLWERGLLVRLLRWLRPGFSR